MSTTLKAKTLIKSGTSYTIIAEEGTYNSTEFAPNGTHLKKVAESIKDGYEFHRTVSVKTATGDIDFVFSQDTKLEEVES